ncbi:ABC transporter ATP-binding protein [Phaeodactylibacter luteus]|uniref:ABC transporter ATP-binding protein n=1 Tax=Phaeodactylibacter luteus TaxID=1564516 RepID=A0A5C6RQX8_9BACT|nr:ABC transporter ATP-binding protein [Phaeodactylibacter luteus]TXB63792.1 ABC transporter ATP-binding protein [Phaeodactylibacter luteus]
MSEPIIKLENISKQYRLGLVGTNTLRGDIQRWWYRMRGKEDPTLKIGEENQLDSRAGEYVWALRDINLEVQQGEVLGIIGKNGAGKSTLLKILSRVTGPTTGRITAHGRIASLLEVGTGFHPELTGRENIYLNGAILGMTKQEIRSKFDEIVDFAGVAKYVDTPVKRYSSGMYVRLAFAVAAHLEPEILIVDEVLAVGDAEFQKKAIGKMQDISKGGGRTVLFVSHNMASVQKLCERSILLEYGKIVLRGHTNEVVNQYLKRSEGYLPESKAIVNLSTHPNKVLDPKIGFQKLRLLIDGKEDTILHTNCVLEIELHVVIRRANENIRLGIVIKSDNNEKLIGLNNTMLGKTIVSEEKKSHVFFIKLPDFPLIRPGIYYIDLYLGDNDGDYDTVKNAASFHLKETDIYSSGKIPYPHTNIVAVPKFDIKKI